MGTSDSKVREVIRKVEARDADLRRDTKTHAKEAHFELTWSGADRFPGCLRDFNALVNKVHLLLQHDFNVHKVIANLFRSPDDYDFTLPDYTPYEEYKRPSWVNRRELYGTVVVSKPIVQNGQQFIIKDYGEAFTIYVHFLNPDHQSTYKAIRDYGKGIPGLLVVFPASIVRRDYDKTKHLLGDDKHFLICDKGMPVQETREAAELAEQIALKLALLMKERIASENAKNSLV